MAAQQRRVSTRIEAASQPQNAASSQPEFDVSAYSASTEKKVVNSIAYSSIHAWWLGETQFSQPILPEPLLIILTFWNLQDFGKRGLGNNCWCCSFSCHMELHFWRLPRLCSSVSHPGPLKDSIILVLSLPLAPFTLASPFFGLLLGELEYGFWWQSLTHDGTKHVKTGEWTSTTPSSNISLLNQ